MINHHSMVCKLVWTADCIVECSLRQITTFFIRFPVSLFLLLFLPLFLFFFLHLFEFFTYFVSVTSFVYSFFFISSNFSIIFFFRLPLFLPFVLTLYVRQFVLVMLTYSLGTRHCLVRLRQPVGSRCVRSVSFGTVTNLIWTEVLRNSSVQEMLFSFEQVSCVKTPHHECLYSLYLNNREQVTTGIFEE